MATKRWSLRQSSSGKSVCLRKGNCDASWGTAIAAHSAAKARAQRAADVAARAEALMKEAEAELARLERTAAQAAHRHRKDSQAGRRHPGRRNAAQGLTCHKTSGGGCND